MTYQDQGSFAGLFWGLLVGAIVFGLAGSWIGAQKGRQANGFWLGFLFGPFGLVVIALLDSRRAAESSQTPPRGDRAALVRSDAERKEAIAEALRRRPDLSTDTPEALRALSEVADEVEKELETRRLRNEFISDSAKTSLERQSVKPDKALTGWTGGQPAKKPFGPVRWDDATQAWKRPYYATPLGSALLIVVAVWISIGVVLLLT